MLEKHYNDRFKALMDQYLPLWRQYRDELNDNRWDMKGGGSDASTCCAHALSFCLSL